MSKTAIVPVPAKQVYPSEGDDRWHHGYPCGYADGWNECVDSIEARPPVPDELIEEAAREMFYKAMEKFSVFIDWYTLPDDEQNRWRNLARAAARVFNGGKDE